ncbi:hypothetical protein JCM11251_007892 [Rhodosporidiobolus azoricus]
MVPGQPVHPPIGNSYLNSRPPPPPPPKSNNTPADSSSKVGGHKKAAASLSSHWNDLPEIDLARRPSGQRGGRERVSSRVSSTLQPIPAGGPAPPSPSSSGSASPVPPSQPVAAVKASARRASVSTVPLPSPSAGTNAPVLPGAGVLPAFNAPPPPPPEPVLSRRYGPRGLPADVLHFPAMLGGSGGDKKAEEEGLVRTADELDVKKEEKGEEKGKEGPKTKLILVFIPGNPGLVSYYRFFLTSLRSALPSPLRESTEMYAIGHLGHSTAPRPGGGGGFKPQEQASLEEQVEDKVRFLDELKGKHAGLGGEGNAKVVVLGHSIGAWIGLQVLHRRPSLLQSLHLLFPTLSHMAQTPNGRTLSPLFSSWTLRPVFYSTSALSYLPTALTSRLVGLITGQNGAGAQTTTELVSSPSTVLAALTMAKEELATVTALDAHLVSSVADKLWFYYAAEGVDKWVIDECVSEVEKAVEGKLGRAGREKRVRRCKEGLPHAFVLDDAHSASLARKCATWITEDLAVSLPGSSSTSSGGAVPPPPPASSFSASSSAPPPPPATSAGQAKDTA